MTIQSEMQARENGMYIATILEKIAHRLKTNPELVEILYNNLVETAEAEEVSSFYAHKIARVFILESFGIEVPEQC